MAAEHATAAAASILAALGLSSTPARLALLTAWITCEKGARGDAWQWNNPLNTTWGLPGSTVMNTDGVRAYASRADGIHATVLTLLERAGSPPHMPYAALVAGLRQGDAQTFFSAAGRAEMRIWGTDPNCVYAVYQQHPASGGSAPPPSSAPPASPPPSSTPPAAPPSSPLATAPVAGWLVLGAAGLAVYGIWRLAQEG